MPVVKVTCKVLRLQVISTERSSVTLLCDDGGQAVDMPIATSDIERWMPGTECELKLQRKGEAA